MPDRFCNNSKRGAKCKTPPQDHPLHKLAPVAVSSIDFLLKTGILTTTNNITRYTRDARQVSTTKIFDNFHAVELQRRTTQCSRVARGHPPSHRACPPLCQAKSISFFQRNNATMITMAGERKANQPPQAWCCPTNPTALLRRDCYPQKSSQTKATTSRRTPMNRPTPTPR